MVKTWAVFAQFFGGHQSMNRNFGKYVVRIPMMGWMTVAHVPVLTQAHMDLRELDILFASKIGIS